MGYYYYSNQWFTEEDPEYDEWEYLFDNIFHQFYDDDQEVDKPIEKDAYKEISRHAIEQNMEGDGEDYGFRDPADMYGHQKELARLR